MSKPTGCTSEIPVRGADYAAHKFMVGSGLATALSNLSNSNISSQARQQMLAALINTRMIIRIFENPLMTIT